MGYLMYQPEALRLWRESLAKILDGPSLAFTGGFPEELGGFFWGALGEEGVVKSPLELLPYLRKAGRITAHTRRPAMRITGLKLILRTS
jgi:hypothetical protein